MKYDFVEIGTSNFETLIEKAGPETVGISIEPLKHYLEQLPNKPRVIKLNAAVIGEGVRGYTEIFYVPEHLVDSLKLPHWLKGCNSMGDYHIEHHKLGVTHLVERYKIDTIPISELFEEYDIEEPEMLKIDTEGADVDILMGFVKYLNTAHKNKRPRNIIFESNLLVSRGRVDQLIDQLANFKYKVMYSHHDTHVVLT